MSNSRAAESDTIYVGGLHFDTTADSLREYFSVYGDVINSLIITDRESGRSKGFGFVTFEDPEDAVAAIEDIRPAVIDGRTVRVNVARPQDRERGTGGRYSDRRDSDRRRGDDRDDRYDDSRDREYSPAPRESGEGRSGGSGKRRRSDSPEPRRKSHSPPPQRQLDSATVPTKASDADEATPPPASTRALPENGVAAKKLRSDLQNQQLANAELSERIAALESMLDNRKAEEESGVSRVAELEARLEATTDSITKADMWLRKVYKAFKRLRQAEDDAKRMEQKLGSYFEVSGDHPLADLVAAEQKGGPGVLDGSTAANKDHYGGKMGGGGSAHKMEGVEVDDRDREGAGGGGWSHVGFVGDSPER